MIFRIDPEDRDGRHAVFARDLVGELESRQRFQQREQRTAEKPGLLTGDERDRARIG